MKLVVYPPLYLEPMASSEPPQPYILLISAAQDILNEPEEIPSLKGSTIPRRLSVDYISFSAHVDYAQNSEFIEQVKAQHVVCLFLTHPLTFSTLSITGSSARGADCNGAS